MVGASIPLPYVARLFYSSCVCIFSATRWARITTVFVDVAVVAVVVVVVAVVVVAVAAADTFSPHTLSAGKV